MSPEQIKRLRKKLGLTQEGFAGLVCADRVTVARWETGASSPRGLYLLALKELAGKTKKRSRK